MIQSQPEVEATNSLTFFKATNTDLRSLIVMSRALREK
jgi:hypothetical protein